MEGRAPFGIIYDVLLVAWLDTVLVPTTGGPVL